MTYVQNHTKLRTNANLARSRANPVHYRTQKPRAHAKIPSKDTLKVKEARRTTEKRQRIVLKRLVKQGKHYLPLLGGK